MGTPCQDNGNRVDPQIFTKDEGFRPVANLRVCNLSEDAECPVEREDCEMLVDATMPAPVPLPTGGEALATLAHELRDPLAAILSALELHSGDGDPAARRTLTMAAHQARRAVRIVDDLFDLCAGSWDSLPLCKEVVELAAVVAGATDATAHLVAAREHRLTVSLPAGPVSLLADPVRLEQVLINLLANAAKFTDRGGDRKSTRLNSSHMSISYAVFCLKKKK